jgi:hypothetical protein
MRRPLRIFLSKLRYNLLLLLGVLILWTGSGCAGAMGPDEEGKAVASYGSTSLYQGEVDAFVPDSLAGADSSRIAGQYVEQWVRRQAIEEALRAQSPDLDQRLRYRLRAYEQALIEQEYQRLLLAQKPELQEIPAQEIRTYYEKHKERFVARTEYYQFFFVETTSTNQQYKVVNLIRSTDSEKIAELLTWCRENATKYKLDSTYLEARDLEPLSAGFYYGNLERASRGTPYPYTLSVNDTTYLRVFRMLEVIKSGEQLPLSLCEDRIASLLRNQRKQELFDSESGKLVQQARMAEKVKQY